MHKSKESDLIDKLSYLENQLRQVIQEKENLSKENIQLRERETRFRYFAAHAQDLMWSTDLDLKVVYVNYYSKSFLGWEPEELMELGVDKMFPFKTLTQVLPYYRQKLKEVKMGNKLESPINLEVELLHKNGKHIWAELKADFIYNEKGKPIGLIGISRNIEARKIAEKKLKEKEELFRLLLKHTSETVYLTDEKGQFQFVGQGKDPIFELDKQQILEKKSINLLFEEDLISTFEKSSSGELKNIRKNIITFGGKRKKLLVNIKEVNIKYGRLLFSCRDITDLEETRRALSLKEMEFEELEKRRDIQQQMMEKAEDLAKWGSWQWNIKDNTFLLSEGWRKIHGYFDEKTGFDDIEKIIHPEDLPKLKNEITRAIKNHDSGEVEVRVLIPGTSNVKYVRSTGKVVLDENNEPEMMIGYVRDMSEYRHTENYLRKNVSRYRKIIDEAPIGIALLKHGNFAYANNVAAEIYGCDDVSSLLKKKLTDFVHEKDIEQVRNKISRVIPANESMDISHKINIADNVSKMLRVVISSLDIEGENYIHAVIEDVPSAISTDAENMNLAANLLSQNEKLAFIEEIEGITEILSDKYQFEEKDRQRIQKILEQYDDRENQKKILQNHFEKQHQEFFARLLEKHPHLTQHELRHCGCMLMNLSTKEIANLFDVQPASIQKSRVRLKKKLKLDPDMDLRTYLHRF